MSFGRSLLLRCAAPLRRAWSFYVQALRWILGRLGGVREAEKAHCLLAGEKGTFDPSLALDEVRTIRKREAAAAYRRLSFRDAESIWLDYPDGELDYAPQLEIRRELVSLIRQRRPDVIFALDPGRKFYRHHYRDQRSAALVSADAIGAAMWPLEYPEWLLGAAPLTIPSASEKYSPDAGPPARADMKQLISFLIGTSGVEYFRRR